MKIKILLFILLFINCIEIPLKSTINNIRNKRILVNKNVVVEDFVKIKKKNIVGFIFLVTLTNNTNFFLEIKENNKMIISKSYFVKPMAGKKYRTIKLLFKKIDFNGAYNLSLKADQNFYIWLNDNVSDNFLKLGKISYNGNLFLEIIYKTKLNVLIKNIINKIKINKSFIYFYIILISVILIVIFYLIYRIWLKK